MRLELYTYAERPELRDNPAFQWLHRAWPEFMHHDATVNRNWMRLYSEVPEFQFFLYAPEDDVVLAEGNAIPLGWDGTLHSGGIDWAFEHGLGSEPTTLCAVQIMIDRREHGRGLSRLMLDKMRTIAAAHGLDGLIAPVRPTLKHRYPLIPTDRYMHWRRADGLPFDPWLRTHERMGAELLGPAWESMRIEAPVSEWKRWAEMEFPEPGDYVVADALVPVRIEDDRGIYVEPNIWMRHSVSD
jgi:GNAT superfamily N-acetyltransferase